MREKNVRVFVTVITTIATAKMPDPDEGKVMVPVYDIPMMSDEKWNRIADQKKKKVTA